MFSTAEKTNNSATVVHRKAQQQAFFRKAEEESFFGSNKQPSFFNSPVQAKLSVSSPDDPQEKEADEVAETVMRMPESATMEIFNSGEEKLDKKEEEEEQVQTKIDLSSLNKISRQEAEEEEEVQAKPEISILRQSDSKESEEEDVQAKLISRFYGKSDESFNSFGDSYSDISNSKETINRKETNNYSLGFIQRNGRDPPGQSISFEQSLTSSKGSGSALPAETREFMEPRFNADFSGVRIHTGTAAQSMSKNIHVYLIPIGTC